MRAPFIASCRRSSTKRSYAPLDRFCLTRRGCLALKCNQGTLRDDVELFAREQKAVAFKDTTVSRDTTVDGDHGRIETRTVTVFHDIGWLEDSHQWPGLKSVVMVESERETEGKAETETRFYITSLTLLANAVGPMIRSHWMVESAPQAHEREVHMN